MAKNKPNWSSSVYIHNTKEGFSSYSIDGNTGDSFWVDGCLVTDIGEREWFIVDLLDKYVIEKIGFVARNGYGKHYTHTKYILYIYII